jgi:type VI secretion system protein ImpA
MTVLPIDEFMAPLGDGAPCGADLEYDAAFLALGEVARGKPEQQFGDTLIPAQAPDWRAVHEQSIELARRTRDLRVAVLLARSAARVHGLAAFASALALIAGLLDRHWAHVYPLLDADDGNDPTMRLNALAPLADAQTGLADLRVATVGAGQYAITVRQLELAFGKAEPHPGEPEPSVDGLLQALKDGEAASPGVLASLKQTHAELLRIEAILTERVGGVVGPDLQPLRRITQCLANAATQAAPGLVEMNGNDAAAQGIAATPAPAGTIRSREDAIRTLERVCEWIERNEPSNPAPLLIRRAQRLMTKSFLEIIRDLVPDGIDQVRKIAGATSD